MKLAAVALTPPAHRAIPPARGQIGDLGRVALSRPRAAMENRGGKPTGLAGDRNHFVGEIGRLVDGVSDEQDRLSGLGADAAARSCRALARDRIERGERLVHQEHIGLDGKRARKRDALALAAG